MTLDEWLEYQQRVHPRGIELGLDRVRRVFDALGSPRPAPLVITVAGTNGKGSTVAILESILRAAGHKVGAYTSPHLLDYTERVRIDGVDLAAETFVAAFERIEAARGDTSLTYFEFGTLAAFLAMHDANVEVAILEVGLGGRLDAVNLIDADVAIVTTVDIDHRDWLGDDRESIGREKAGVFRAGRPAIVGEPDPPRSVAEHATEIYDRDFTIEGLRWRDFGRDIGIQLDPPSLQAPAQLRNIATAIAALHSVRERWRWSSQAVVEGVRAAHVPGRLQRIRETPEVVVDVAHNPQAAHELSRWLRRRGGRNLAVFSALGDKDIAGIVAPLVDSFAHWFVGGLAHESPRGLSGEALAELVDVPHSTHATVEDAYRAALAMSADTDRIIAFGSFLTVAAVLKLERGQPL